MHPRLRGLVEHLSAYSYDPGPVTGHRGMPSTMLTAVIAFGQPLDVGRHGEPRTQQAYWTLAAGLGTRPAQIRQVGHQEGVYLGLTPAGSRVLLGVPAAALSDELVSFDDLFGARTTARLYDDVASAPTTGQRIDVLQRWLVALSDRHDDGATARPEVERAWAQLTADAPAVPVVSDVADEVGWSRRHLTEQFRAELGVTPRDARRLGRFSRSHRLARRPGVRLADVAAGSGYADQAHMTREWRELAAYSPGEWVKAELSFVQDQSA